MEKNTLTLEESITHISGEEKEKALQDFSDLACKLMATLYETLNLFRQDPPNKLDSHMLLFQTRLNDELTGEYHNKMFEIAFNKRLNLDEYTEKIKEDVKKGKALPLGDIVIEDFYMSNVLSGNEVQLGLNFMLRENYEEKQRIKEEEELKLKKEKEKLMEDNK